MPTPYPLLYRIGFTPWERTTSLGPLPGLLDELPPGRALDAGCGTGRHSVLAARAGWTVIGVDSVERPLRAARARAVEAGVSDRVSFVRGDVTRLGAVVPDGSFDLVMDVGCLHGLSAAGQGAFASWVTSRTREGARLVVLAALPRRGIGPKGIDGAALAALFAEGWSMADTAESPGQGGGPLRDAEFRWYHLRRETSTTA
ncbi:MAG: cyclopropane-fatty-acyl-phospholipid synthase family protein [Thermoleophilia bacterium]